jgi:hypothetical protein
MTVGSADRPPGYGPVAFSRGMDSMTGDRCEFRGVASTVVLIGRSRSAEPQIVDVGGDKQRLWNLSFGVVVAVDAPGERHSDAVDRAEIRGVVARSSVVR